MSLIENLRPENNKPEYCIGCPDRSDGMLQKSMAIVALGGSYKACHAGPFVTNKTTWVEVAEISRPQVVGDIGLSFNRPPLTIPVSFTQKRMSCGKTDFPQDLATHTLVIEGQTIHIDNLKTGERIWPAVADYEA